ncbi:MAG: hypothetical protein K9K38_16735, partial [Rhodoferax sp.]|nr:hypothetical protein [Rhodoferax sp.]
TTTQGQTLTAANTLADTDGIPSTGTGSIAYQWSAGGTDISGATSSTLVLGQAQVGKTITLTAKYTDGFGTTETVASSASAAVANVNNLPSGGVTITITGTVTRGAQLTAANTLADLDGLGTISYQWKAAESDISGATASTYTLTQAEVGKTITVVAKYTDLFSAQEAVESTATTAVTAVNVAPTGTVSFSGTATQGQTLTAANTLADIDGIPSSGAGALAYQWSVGGTVITGATGITFVLTQAEVGKTITVTASYTDLHGTTESKTSSATAAVSNVNDPVTGDVTITGTPTQGQTLTAANTLADLDGIPATGTTGALAYQWSAADTAITGATGSTFVLTQAEVGKTITVTASYTDLQGTSESASSPATTAVLGYQVGTAGDDVLTGTAFADTLITDSGADLVNAGAGNDTLTLSTDGTWASGFASANQGMAGMGGTGQQVLLYGKVRFADVLNGGEDADTLQLTSGSDAFFLHDAYSLFNIGAVLTQDTGGKLSAARSSGIEIIQGGAGDDIIDLTSLDYTIGAVSVFADIGNDIVWGNAGNDTLQGGEGADTLFGGSGSNTLNGGAGADLFQYAKSGTAQDILQDFQAGIDTIVLYGALSTAEVSATAKTDRVTLIWGTQTIDLMGITSTTGWETWLQLA